jgi:ribonuclease R
MFTRLLEQASASPFTEMVHELVLRSQSQAVYSPVNLGHFGLALARYCHFTSPIRRYSDLLVHRALITGCRLGDGGLPPGAGDGFEALGQHISTTERRAAAAERDAVDRFIAGFLARRLGEILPGRVTGVTRFGLFIRLDETGADGLAPINSLPDDFYDHDESRHCLVGRRWGAVYRLGERAMARIIQAEPITGGLVLELVEGAREGAMDEGLAMKKPGTTKKPSNLKVKNRHPRQAKKPRRHGRL